MPKNIDELAKEYKEEWYEKRIPVHVDCICHWDLFHSEECIKNELRQQPRSPTIPERLILAFKAGYAAAKKEENNEE